MAKSNCVGLRGVRFMGKADVIEGNVVVVYGVVIKGDVFQVPKASFILVSWFVRVRIGSMCKCLQRCILAYTPRPKKLGQSQSRKTLRF